MGKRKSGILKPLILLVIGAVMVGCFFMPWISATLSGGIGSITGSLTTTVSGIESVGALFGAKGSTDQSAAMNLAIGLQGNHDVSAAMSVNAVCLLALAVVGLLTVVFAVYSVVKRKKMKLAKLFAVLFFVFAVSSLVCSLVVAGNAGSLDLGIVKYAYSISAASIVATILSLGGLAAAFGMKK